jgi:fatty-acyl-CoA synthase
VSEGPRRGLDIGSTLRRALELFPGAEAVQQGARHFDYRGLAARVAARLEEARDCGLVPGERWALLADNGLDFLEAYYAAALCGAVLVPLNTRLAAPELAAILDDCGARLLGAEPRFAALAREVCGRAAQAPTLWFFAGEPESGLANGERPGRLAPEAVPDRAPEFAELDEQTLAHLYYTSGTTGVPKGVMLSHRNVTQHAWAAAVELGLTDGDTWGHVAPMFHLADAWATFAVTLVGGRHVFLPRFEPEAALDLLEGQGVTLTNLVPTMLQLMVARPGAAQRDWSKLRLLLSGGAPIAPEVVRVLRETFRCEYVQTYGMTETSPYLTLSRLSRQHRALPEAERLRLAARTGRPFLGVELEVVDGADRVVPADDRTVGEIRVRGATVTAGYWRRPEATAEALRGGWLYTGDLATIDGHGFVEIRDRRKDMILTGGENVYSIEVENVLYAHPGVLEVAAFGRPDPTWGEVVWVAVALRPGHHAAADELLRHCRGQLAGYKVPRGVEFWPALPRTGSGKLLKRALREGAGPPPGS